MTPAEQKAKELIEKDKRITIDLNNGQAQLHYTNCTPIEVIGALTFFQSNLIATFNKAKIRKNFSVKTAIEKY